MAAPPKSLYAPSKIEAAKNVIEQFSDKFKEVFPRAWKAKIASMSPRDVMLTAMQLAAHKAHQAGETIDADSDTVVQLWRDAALLAEKVAPYIHVKLANLQISDTVDPFQGMSEEQKRGAYGFIAGLLRSEPGNPGDTSTETGSRPH